LRVGAAFRYVGSLPCIPEPYAVAIVDVRAGSSEYPSSLRPHSGFRSRFTTGAQRLSPHTVGFWEFRPRASSPTTEPTFVMSAGSQVLARPTACGNTVAVAVTTLPLLLKSQDHPTPCSASVPALNTPIPSRGIAGWYWCMNAIFSSTVRRAMRSSMRFDIGSVESRNGRTADGAGVTGGDAAALAGARPGSSSATPSKPDKPAPSTRRPVNIIVPIVVGPTRGHLLRAAERRGVLETSRSSGPARCAAPHSQTGLDYRTASTLQRVAIGTRSHKGRTSQSRSAM
jgi:hypothetical protein